MVQAQLSARRSCTPGFRGCAPMMGATVVVRNADLRRAGFVTVDERAAFGRCLPRWEIAGVNFYEKASYVVRGWAPMMGAGVVVRNAGIHPYTPWDTGRTYGKTPAVGVVLTAGVLCEVVGSAVTYSPTPSREQYHRRGRA